MNDETTKIVWADTESTGLNTNNDNILQLAMLVTDLHLNELDHLCLDIFVSRDSLAKMDDVAREMHKKSGLLDRVKVSAETRFTAEDKAIALIERHFTEEQRGRIVLCGSTIAFDRRLFAREMPTLGKMFHYRMLDVSALKVMAKLWYQEVEYIGDRSKKHDALHDIRSSVAELKHYIGGMMRLPFFEGAK
jgi:oligoribonuclease